MDFQYYPTPKELARRMFGLFKNRDVKRLLEPSAGRGHLACEAPGFSHSGRSKTIIDCCEIDISKHADLRSKGLNVVGMDFMEFGSGAAYSHCVMNPPFAYAVQHLLKAWDVLWDAEIVCLLNAESLRNPFSAERRQLLRLIDKHGSVEFIENAFMVDEAERSTPVDVALVYLRKEVEAGAILGNILEALKVDKEDSDSLTEGYAKAAQLMLPNNFIENTVLAFNSAVKSMREACLHEVRANHYENLLGATMAEVNGAGKQIPKDLSASAVQTLMGTRYDKLKDKAWTTILRSSNVTSKLSRNAQKRVESEFDQIKALEFTTVNVYGFICGLVDSAGEIQNQMILDTFDSLAKHHSENTCYFMGWVSNDRHRTLGMRLKTTRCIIPNHKPGYDGLDYDSERYLDDIDRVFAILDGKSAPEVSLRSIFTTHWTELSRLGHRVEASYFSARYYKGIGTIHLFPRSQEMMDRLNRYVGKQRAWLPPDTSKAGPGFWKQYDEAHKMEEEIRKEVMQSGSPSYYRNHFATLFYKDADSKEAERAREAIVAAMSKVQERHGIDIDLMLETTSQQPLLLAA